MNSQSLSPSSQLSSPQPELLYGNGAFLARLWHIPAGQQAELHPLLGQSGSQFILIAGSLQVIGQNAPGNLTLGQHIRTNNQTGAWTLQNPGNSTAILLDIAQGQNLQRVAMPEVTETRPWGSFTVFKDEPDYKLKQLLNTPGNRLSLQRHQKREEHWMVVAGQPEITLDDATHHLKPGDYIHIPLHSWHRLSNPDENAEPVELIELQLGSYFGEDDIERRQDDYGRA